ncbi:histidine kinase [Microtetraspora sp. AC03309]|uniref:sensor histidine kinase n=1 Tax=Microtetraspora sp. AC03309 TaxID=2779376 RepID=UPI001E497594|nr:histidine kinase [Microtetraspora sp. AC03309]
MNRRTLTALARGAGLLGLAVLGQLVGLVMLVAIALSFLIGLVFVFSPAVRLTRATTRLQRRLAAEWSGVTIDEPYRPAPPPPQRQRDGWYREGRNLYKTPRVPAFNRRLSWLVNDPATWRDFAYLMVSPWSSGLIVGIPLLLAVIGVPQLVDGNLAGLLPLVVALATAPAVAPWSVHVHGQIAHGLLAPTEKARLAQRVSHLARTRIDAVDSQAAELRRIERDLHDGAQARLVAIGMTIGAAEQLVDSDPAAAKALLAKASEASATALRELRQVVRGIHPPVLAERGLGDAVRALALDTPLTSHVTADLPTRPDAPVESAAYFAVSELLTNAVRHGDATEVWIDISHQGTALRVTVTDDGRGGADPERGTGLRGIERRLAAFDGVLAVNSPVGGPTTAAFELTRALEETIPPLPRWKRTILGLCWGLCWLPLFPQGLVAMVMKLVGSPERSWFLALYLPEPLQWPTIIGMICLGGVMLATGVTLANQAKRAKVDACASS